MKKSTSILLICGGIFAGLLFLKNGKNGLDKLKSFLQDLANGLGDLSKAIWDGIKNFWEKLKIKSSGSILETSEKSTPLTTFSKSSKSDENGIESRLLGYYDEENDIYYSESELFPTELREGVNEGRFFLR